MRRLRERLRMWVLWKLQVVPMSEWEETEHQRYLARQDANRIQKRLLEVLRQHRVEIEEHWAARHAYVAKLTELTKDSNPSGIFVLPVGGKLETAEEYVARRKEESASRHFQIAK